MDLICQSLMANAAWATSSDWEGKRERERETGTTNKIKITYDPYLTVDQGARQAPVGQLHKGGHCEEHKLGCHSGILQCGHNLKRGHGDHGKAGNHLCYEGAMEYAIVLAYCAVERER